MCDMCRIYEHQEKIFVRHFEFDCFLNLCLHSNFVCRSPRIKKKQKQDKETARFVGFIMKYREVRFGLACVSHAVAGANERRLYSQAMSFLCETRSKRTWRSYLFPQKVIPKNIQ